jgi:hypothetical protein
MQSYQEYGKYLDYLNNEILNQIHIQSYWHDELKTNLEEQFYASNSIKHFEDSQNLKIQ